MQVDDVESRLKTTKARWIMKQKLQDDAAIFPSGMECAAGKMTQVTDHRQASAVDQTADAAVELNVVQIEFGGGNLYARGVTQE